MATPISQYFASVAIKVDQTSLKSVDTYFKTLESKFKFYSGRFGQGLTLKVNFQANIRDLIRGIQAKLDPKGNGVGVRIRITPRIAQGDIGALRRQLVGGLANIPVTVRYSGNFRQTLMNRINQAIAPSRPQGGSGRSSGGATRSSSGGGSTRGGTMGANLAGGVLGRALRFGAGGIPLVGGAIGFNKLNEANTDFQSQKLAAEGIFAGKLPGGGDAARQQLFSLAQLNGFDYKATLPNFTRFMANGMETMGYNKSFNAFSAITSFGRARGATANSMDRALYGFGQMMGKGKVMSEELFQQIVESSGFGEMGNVFAKAWAQKTKSGLTGDAAQTDLREAMKKGKVVTNEVLPFAQEIMNQMIAAVLDKSRNTADAKQMRFRNARTKFNERFSEAGGEVGLQKFWDAAGAAMEKLADKAPQLANAFEKLVDNTVKLIKSFMDIHTTLTGGFGNETTINIQRETGINIVKIRDVVTKVFDFVSNNLGASALAATAAIVAVSLLKAKIWNTVGEAADKVTGNTNALRFFAHGNALRVFVVNNGGGGFDIGGNQSNQKGGTNSPKTVGGKAKVVGGVLGALALNFGLQHMVQSEYLDALVDTAFYAGTGALAGLEVGGPWGGLVGLAGGLGFGAWKNADTLFGSKIEDATPVVEQAAKQEATLNHDFMLKADINITAQNGQEALDIFAREMESKVFAPFMRQSLQEAQSTYSIYAR